MEESNKEIAVSDFLVGLKIKITTKHKRIKTKKKQKKPQSNGENGKLPDGKTNAKRHI